MVCPPGGEAELCGHAPLATAYVITRFTEPGPESVGFDTASGRLTADKNKDLLTMDFPSFSLKPLPVSAENIFALSGVVLLGAYIGADIVCVLEAEIYI